MVQRFESRERGFDRRVYKTIFLVLVCICARNASALNPERTLSQYSHRVWHQEEGLPETTIHSLLQARDGHLWLGTPNGLLRFDGKQFLNFFETAPDPAPPAMVPSIYEDSDGTLWAASFGNGLARISGRKLTWFTIHEGLPANETTCVTRHNEGLWVCTVKGLVDFRGGVHRTYTTADGLPNDRVHSVCDAADGTTWVGSIEFGLGQLRDGKFAPFSDPAMPPRLSVYALLCSTSGDLWAGTNSGLYRISGSVTKVYSSKDGLPDEVVRTLTEDGNGTLWVGTQSGVARIEGDRLSSYGSQRGLSHPYVLSLLSDREGSLWVGTRNGLDQFTDSPVLPFRIEDGLPGDDTGALIEDRHGTLWLGTKEHGLWKAAGRRISALTRVQGIRGRRVLSLANAPNGELWVGTEFGLHRLRAGNVASVYTAHNGLPGNQIRALFIDPKSTLWVGTEHGLRRFTGRSFVPAAGGSVLDTAPITALGSTRDLDLLVSTDDGQVFALSAQTWRSLETPEPARPVTSFYENVSDGSLWMTSAGAGLLRWKDGALKRIRTWDGLFDSVLYDMEPDSHGGLWFASSKGIFRMMMPELEAFVSGKRPAVTSVPYATGQVRFECSSGAHPAVWRSREDTLWFSTTKGLAVIDPARLRSNALAPPVRIESLLVNGSFRWPDESTSFSPGEKNITIRYAGLSYVSPEKLTFRYKLEGYDKDWIDVRERREAFYTNLPAGSFVFRVRSSNSDGVSSPEEAIVRFSIEPYFYQRIWFIPAAFLAVAAAILLAYRMRVRQLRKQFEVVLAERSRIARELHDTLLQGFSGVTMQLRALFLRLPKSPEQMQLHEIIEDSAACLKEARWSVMGLRRAREHSAELGSELAQLARDAVAGRRVELTLDIAAGPIHVPEQAERHLLRIAREAIANALRHGNPMNICVRLKRKQQDIEMSIEDDGSGFDAEAREVEFGHYGLIGMRERASEIHAELIVRSAPGCGTEVRVTYTSSVTQVTALDQGHAKATSHE